MPENIESQTEDRFWYSRGPRIICDQYITPTIAEYSTILEPNAQSIRWHSIDKVFDAKTISVKPPEDMLHAMVFKLPLGIESIYERADSYPEYIFAERGGYIDLRDWDSAKILKKRRLKFTMTKIEILDGVRRYVYELDKF